MEIIKRHRGVKGGKKKHYDNYNFMLYRKQCTISDASQNKEAKRYKPGQMDWSWRPCGE